jgi:drug/metabolite transporter (DMT)-like permease
MRAMGNAMCIGSGAAFGAMAIFAKLAYGEGATVGTLLAVRFTIAAALFWAIILARDGVRPARALRRRDLAAGLALGACGYALQSGLYFSALTRVDASLLALLLYIYPALVAVAAAAIGRERLSLRRGAALVLALGGGALVIAGAGVGSLDGLGTALGLGAAAVYSTYILVSDGVVGRVSPLLLAALVCTGAAVTLTAGSLALGEYRPGELTGAGWGLIGLLAVVSTVGAIALFFGGLRRVGPTAASILGTFEPVVTVLLAFAVFGETLGALQLCGGMLVVSAVLVLNLRARPAPVAAATAPA